MTTTPRVWRLSMLVALATTGMSACNPSGLSLLERSFLDEMAKPDVVPGDATNRAIGDPNIENLGRQLYFDRRFSGPLVVGTDTHSAALGRSGDESRVGCVDCHDLKTGAADRRHDLKTSLGSNFTSRHSPSVFYLGDNGTYFSWDGSRDSGWNQTLVPMESHAAHNTSRLYVVRVLVEEYAQAWTAAFPDVELPSLDEIQQWNEPRDESGELLCEPPKSGPSCFCTDPDDIAAGVACLPPSASVRGRVTDWEWDLLTDDEKHLCNNIYAHFAKSLDAYVRVLRPFSSPFDRFLDGDESALSPAALRGAQLFVGKASCNECHRGPSFTDQSFRHIGVPSLTDSGRADGLKKLLSPGVTTFSVCGAFSDETRLVDDEGKKTACGERTESIIACSFDDECPKGVFSCRDPSTTIPGVCGEARDTCFGADPDRGVVGVCIAPSLVGAFKVPTLRNVEKSAPYMHNGSLQTLWDVVAFYNEAEGTDGFQGERDRTIVPLGLDDNELSDLVAFLRALTDDLDAVDDERLSEMLTAPDAP